MELSTIKTILKNNKEYLKGKTLQVGFNTYNSLRDFGNAILESSRKKETSLSMVLTLNDRERCLSVENALNYTFKSGRFDTVKVFEIQETKQAIIDYSSVDFERFGTTA